MEDEEAPAARSGQRSQHVEARKIARPSRADLRAVVRRPVVSPGEGLRVAREPVAPSGAFNRRAHGESRSRRPVGGRGKRLTSVKYRKYLTEILFTVLAGLTPFGLNLWLTSAMRPFGETELSAHTDSHT